MTEGSNYDFVLGLAEVSEERTCPRCRGLGTVEVHGQETDCIDCDGMGSVLIEIP